VASLLGVAWLVQNQSLFEQVFLRTQKLPRSELQMFRTRLEKFIEELIDTFQIGGDNNGKQVSVSDWKDLLALTKGFRPLDGVKVVNTKYEWPPDFIFTLLGSVSRLLTILSNQTFSLVSTVGNDEYEEFTLNDVNINNISGNNRAGGKLKELKKKQQQQKQKEKLSAQMTKRYKEHEFESLKREINRKLFPHPHTIIPDVEYLHQHLEKLRIQVRKRKIGIIVPMSVIGQLDLLKPSDGPGGWARDISHFLEQECSRTSSGDPLVRIQKSSEKLYVKLSPYLEMKRDLSHGRDWIYCYKFFKDAAATASVKLEPMIADAELKQVVRDFVT
jgi:hypothetical protein